MFLVIILVLLFLLHSLFIHIYHNNTNFNDLILLQLQNFKDTLILIYDFLLVNLMLGIFIILIIIIMIIYINYNNIYYYNYILIIYNKY